MEKGINGVMKAGEEAAERRNRMRKSRKREKTKLVPMFVYCLSDT